MKSYAEVFDYYSDVYTEFNYWNGRSYFTVNRNRAQILTDRYFSIFWGIR